MTARVGAYGENQIDGYWAASATPVDHGLRVEQARWIAEVLDTR